MLNCLQYYQMSYLVGKLAFSIKEAALDDSFYNTGKF